MELRIISCTTTYVPSTLNSELARASDLASEVVSFDNHGIGMLSGKIIQVEPSGYHG